VVAILVRHLPVLVQPQMENIGIAHKKSVRMESQRESEIKRDWPLSSPLYSSVLYLSNKIKYK
jgi:hypothetical protein